MKKNLTLSLDEDLLHKARIVCQKRKTTLTKYVRSQLEELVHHDEEYHEAMKRMMELMKKRPIRVGKKTWTREELHER
jgi:hypothetical protein